MSKEDIQGFLADKKADLARAEMTRKSFIATGDSVMYHDRSIAVLHREIAELEEMLEDADDRD